MVTNNPFDLLQGMSKQVCLLSSDSPWKSVAQGTTLCPATADPSGCQGLWNVFGARVLELLSLVAAYRLPPTAQPPGTSGPAQSTSNDKTFKFSLIE